MQEILHNIIHAATLEATGKIMFVLDNEEWKGWIVFKIIFFM